MEMFLEDGGVLFKPYHPSRYIEEDIQAVMRSLRSASKGIAADAVLLDTHGRNVESPSLAVPTEDADAAARFLELYQPWLLDSKRHQILFRIKDDGQDCMCLLINYRDYEDEKNVAALSVAGSMAAKLLEAKLNR